MPPDLEQRTDPSALSADVDRCASLYRLRLPRTPLAGPAGRSAGADLGASLDFQDFRSYFAGDDVRHVDWSVYARSDNLVVRLYREEVSPDVEVVLDCSRSMASTPPKAAFARGMTRLLAALAARERGAATLVLAGDEAQRIRGADIERALGGDVFAGTGTLADVLAAGGSLLRKRSVRVVVSDFLFPHAAPGLISLFARRAAALYVVQVLDPSELVPDFLGGRLLIDVETGDEANIVVNDEACERYRARLDSLSAELARQCRLWNAPFARAAAGPLEPVCRDVLLAAGVLEAV